MSAKYIKIGEAAIPLSSYAIGGTALLGIRGSGKTWTAKGIAEQLLEHGVPIIVFDPIGVWRHLKVPAVKGGKGYPVVVAGGKGADLPLTPASAQEIVRAAMRENIPLVIDLYDKALSKADWRRIVQACFRTLLYENEGMRHIFLEEAAEYCPQKVQDGETYAEVEKLVRMGGNASLGITLINQRAQEVNKAVLDLCENLVLMRQTGAHAIDSIEKWVDKLSPDFAKKISLSMPKMQTGEAWVFSSSAEYPLFTRSGAIRTYHPDRKHPEAKVAAAATDTSSFVEAMQRALPAIAEQLQANDPKKLKAEIARLTALNVELGKANAGLQTNTTQASTEVYRQRIAALEENDALLRRWIKTLEDRHDSIRPLIGDLDDARAKIGEIIREPFPILPDAPLKLSAPVRAVVTHRAAALRTPAAATPAPRSRSNGSAELGKGERAVLLAIAQHPDGCDRTQIAVLTGYKESSRKLFAQILRRHGFITDGWPAKATVAGIAALGDEYEPLPTGEALREHWLARLGGGERVMFDALCRAYPDGLSAAELESAGDYKASSRKLYMQLLKARKLVEKRAGKMVASGMLFG